MSERSSERATILVCSGMGVVAGLICAVAILAPLSQCLIDSDDDDVVLATILYFKYAAGAFFLVCCVAGGLMGRLVARLFQWPPRSQENSAASSSGLRTN